MADVEYTPEIAVRNTAEALFTHPDVEAFELRQAYGSALRSGRVYDVRFKDGETYRFEIQLMEAMR